ncbi:MAG: hypothetical protein HRF40_09960 [Nitrososphaera sp.]|jgi:hypothetical protein
MADIDSREYAVSPDRLFEILQESLPHAGFKIRKIEKEIRRIELSTGMSLFSFGESLEVIVSANGTGSVLYVKSKAKIAWNISADTQGKVDTLFGIIKERLRS